MSKTVGEQESVIPASGYIPIDSRIPDFGSAIDDRTRFQKLQGHRYYVKYPQPLTGEEKAIADSLAETEKRIADAKRSEQLNKMTADQKHAFILREEQQLRQVAADKATADKQRAKEWNEKYGAEIDELRAIRQEMTTSGNGWQVSEVLAVDDAIKQLSAVGSDESYGEKLYDAVVSNFDTRQDDIEMRLRAEAMGHVNRADALLRRVPRQPEPEPESPLEKLIREQREFRAKIEAAEQAGDSDKVSALLAERKAQREAAGVSGTGAALLAQGEATA